MKWRMIGEVARSEHCRIVERDCRFNVYRHFGILRNEMYASKLHDLSGAIEYTEYAEQMIEKEKIWRKEAEEREREFKRWLRRRRR